MTARKLNEELAVCDPPPLAYWQGTVGGGPDQLDRRKEEAPVTFDDAAALMPPQQSALPADYRLASAQDVFQRISAARQALGERLLILGHHYQRDEIVCHADAMGDSFQLAQCIRDWPRAEAIVFCGVHFMAETAAILAGAHQQVILPHLGAGCSMADMADTNAVQQCWQQLSMVWQQNPHAATSLPPLIPVTYMNSSAALKAFCGHHGGIVCTSSNARMVMEWAFARGQRILFFPDQHLGRNTAHAMCIPTDQICVWNAAAPLGGLTPEQIMRAKVLLWNGYCSVHQRFSVAQIQAARSRYPHVRVIVHPECSQDVVAQADAVGSTDAIIRAIQSASPGQVFAIGTEINLVRRLAHHHPEHQIFCLDPVVCPCSTMYRIHPAYLAWVLDGLLEGQVRNRIRVDAACAAQAHVALSRMLAARP